MALFLKHFFSTDKPIFPVEFGHSSYEMPRKVGPWSREMYILHFVVRGYSDFSGLIAREGDAFFISKERLHTFTTSPDYEHYWIGFDGEEIDALFRSLGLEYNSHQVFRVENFDFAKTLFLETRKRMDNEKTENASALVLSTLLSVLGLLRTGTETKTPKKINYAEKAATLIKNNYMYQLRMSDVAREVHLTEKYLYRLFMERFGISLQQFLIKTRMEKAYELLGSGELSVTEVSCSVGYASVSVFSKTFSKYFGTPPSAVKK